MSHQRQTPTHTHTKARKQPYPWTTFSRCCASILTSALLCAVFACQPSSKPCTTQNDCGQKAYCYKALKVCLPLSKGFTDGGPPLPRTPVAPDEQGGACQQHQCETGATRCTSSGWLSRCITHTVTGCRTWTPGSPCAQGLLCEKDSSTGQSLCRRDSPYETELSFCIAELNRYRQQAGLSLLIRDPTLEAFGQRAVEHDAKDGKPHSYFNQTKGDGISRAENEIPGWPQSQYESIKKVIEIGTKMMYNQGPGGGHHDNIVNPQFTKAGCGVFVSPQGEVWIAQEFR